MTQATRNSSLDIDGRFEMLRQPRFYMGSMGEEWARKKGAISGI
jgi:hypothetical protein